MITNSPLYKVIRMQRLKLHKNEAKEIISVKENWNMGKNRKKGFFFFKKKLLERGHDLV